MAGLLDAFYKATSGLMTKADLESGPYWNKYSWKAVPGDNPHITGKPDSGRVSRSEGYEVLDFINAFAKKHTNLTSKLDGKKIEKMLHVCPEVMREKVTSWIEANWGNY